MSQSLILPPTDRPYFLLLQGYDQSKVWHAHRWYQTHKYWQTTPKHAHYVNTWTHADMHTLPYSDVHICKTTFSGAVQRNTRAHTLYMTSYLHACNHRIPSGFPSLYKLLPFTIQHKTASKQHNASAKYQCDTQNLCVHITPSYIMTSHRSLL